MVKVQLKLSGALMNRVLAIIAFSLVVATIIIVFGAPPASGYEISIYAAYPTHFWLLIVGSYACGIILLVRQAFASEGSSCGVWGFAAILLTNSIVLLLPVFRGYAFYGFADPGAQTGFVKDIMLQGRFGAAATLREDVYPATHILVASISYATGLDSRTLIMLAPAGFFIFYELMIFMLSRRVANSHGQSLLIIAFGTPLLLSWFQATFLPSILTFFLLPFVLFLYYKNMLAPAGIAHNVSFILASLLLPFSHPGDTLAFILVFLCFGVSLIIYRRLVRSHIGSKFLGSSSAESNGILAFLSTSFEKLSRHQAERALTTVAVPVSSLIKSIPILLIAWFVWFSTFNTFSISVKGFHDWLIYGTGESQASLYLSWLRRVNAPMLEGIRIFLNTHGQTVPYFVLSIIVSSLFWMKLILSRKDVNLNHMMFFSLFLAFAMLTPLSFVSGFQITYKRTLPYAIFASIIVCGLGSYKWIKGSGHKTIATCIIVTILLASATIGVFNVHWSPFIRAANQQVTAMELDGMRWFLQYQIKDHLIDQIALQQYSIAAVLLGSGGLPSNMRWGTDESYRAPDHFGYDRNRMYGESYEQNRYFLLNKLSQIWEREGTPEYTAFWRFTPTDWLSLRNDISVQRVFDNGEFQVFYIVSQR